MSNASCTTGWEYCALGDAATLITKGTTPTTAGFPFVSSGIPFIKIENINEHGINLKQVSQFISAEAHRSLGRSQFSIGDILFSIAGTIGKTALVSESHVPANTNQAVAIIRGTSDTFAPRFLLYQLRSASRAIVDSKARGGAMNNISLGDLKEVKLVLPPLPEQKRIADKLDSVLARVDACRDRLDHLPALLKRFRQSILAAATSGRLTEDWREVNIAKRTWNTTKLENLCETVFDGPFGSNLKSDDYTNSGVRVVRLENIGHLNFEASKETYISDEKYQGLVRHSLQPDDILFSSFVDEEVRACLYPANLPTAAINKADCFCLRPDRSKCIPTYLSYRLASRSTYVELKELVHGATRPRINLKQLRQYLVELPELEEQTEIVRRVELLFAFADRLEARLATARKQVGQLTPALLAKAFRGELVAQDPADEPAAELLKRLAAQRAAAPKVKRGRSPA